MEPKELEKEKKVKEKEMKSRKEKESKQTAEMGKKDDKTTQEETKQKYSQILDTTRIRRRNTKTTGTSGTHIKFCYKGVDYSTCVPPSVDESTLCRYILHELYHCDQFVFLPEIDVQAKSFFTKDKKGKVHLTIPEGYIIPVLAVDVERSYAPSNSVDLTSVKSVTEFVDKLEKGQYADKESLTITASKNLMWKQLKRVLTTVMEQPFSHLHTLTFNLYRAVSKGCLTKLVMTSFMPELKQIVVNYRTTGISYDLREKRKRDKEKAAQKKAAQKNSTSEKSQPPPTKSNLNANAKAFVPAGYFVPRSEPYRNQKSKRRLDDRTREVNWERDYARVDFTRRFSISEERANPNATEATKNATGVFRGNNRKHRNINRNNIQQGKLPEMEQLIQDLALDQSQLLSIRINLPVDVSVLTRFLEAFMGANCASINTLCLCQLDFTGISCDLLKRFMECRNMQNLEVLSFMKSTLNDDQLRVILEAILNHHMDNLQDMNFEDVTFSMSNLELLHQIIHDQVLLKIWCIHLRNIMDGFDPKKLELIKDIFNTINVGKML